MEKRKKPLLLRPARPMRDRKRHSSSEELEKENETRNARKTEETGLFCYNAAKFASNFTRSSKLTESVKDKDSYIVDDDDEEVQTVATKRDDRSEAEDDFLNDSVEFEFAVPKRPTNPSKMAAKASVLMALVRSEETVRADQTDSFVSVVNCNNNRGLNVMIDFGDGRKMQKFKIDPDDCFMVLLEKLSSQEGVVPARISLSRDQKHIGPTDTPTSIGLSKDYEILRAVILPESLVSELDESKDSRDDLITVKVQTSKERQPREFKISKKETLKDLYKQCAAAYEIDLDALKLHFDGDVVDKSETPETLDLEGEEIFEII